MSKKGENLYKRKDGRWEGRYIRSHNENGKINYGYIYGKAYTEVKQKLLKIKGASDYRHEESRNQITTYNRLLDDWLRFKCLNTKESTYARYAHLIRSHIRPRLGSYKISQLSTQMIEDFIADQLQTGRLDHRGGLAPKTVTDMLGVIKSKRYVDRLNKLISSKTPYINASEYAQVNRDLINRLTKCSTKQIHDAEMTEPAALIWRYALAEPFDAIGYQMIFNSLCNAETVDGIASLIYIESKHGVTAVNEIFPTYEITLKLFAQKSDPTALREVASVAAWCENKSAEEILSSRS